MSARGFAQVSQGLSGQRTIEFEVLAAKDDDLRSVFVVLVDAQRFQGKIQILFPARGSSTPALGQRQETRYGTEYENDGEKYQDFPRHFPTSRTPGSEMIRGGPSTFGFKRQSS